MLTKDLTAKKNCVGKSCQNVSLYAVWAGYGPVQGDAKATTDRLNGKQYKRNLEELHFLSALEYTRPRLVQAVGEFPYRVFIMGCV